MPTDIELADEIDRFLEKHARLSPNYDPAWDEPGDRFTGPDPAMLGVAAQALREGQEPPRVWSSWGSCCYDPIHQPGEAEVWHDRLVRAVNDRTYEVTVGAPGMRR